MTISNLPTLIILLFATVLQSCGNEYFVDEVGEDEQQREETAGTRYTATLQSLTGATIASGRASVHVNGNEARVDVDMDQVPTNIVAGRYSVQDVNCQDLTQNTGFTTSGSKTLEINESGTTTDLLKTSSSLAGKSLVISAFYTDAANPQTVSSTAIACGELAEAQRETDDDDDEDAPPIVFPGVTAGTTAGVASGSPAGATSGVDAGTTAGTTAGLTSGMAAGATAGAAAGSAAGATGFTVGGVAGGVGTGTTGTVGGTFEDTTTGGFTTDPEL